jgi:hypothetical protein
MPLTKSQDALLQRMDRKDYPPLSDMELAELPGFHFCPDWDFLPICLDSPEADACTCANE